MALATALILAASISQPLANDKAAEIFNEFTDSEKRICGMGIFPANKMPETTGDRDYDHRITVRLMELSREYVTNNPAPASKRRRR